MQGDRHAIDGARRRFMFVVSSMSDMLCNFDKTMITLYARRVESIRHARVGSTTQLSGEVLELSRDYPHRNQQNLTH